MNPVPVVLSGDVVRREPLDVRHACFLEIRREWHTLDIGWTWLAASAQRTAVNTEAKFLLLRHAFEDLGALRVQFKTDLRNTRSQQALERLGAARGQGSGIRGQGLGVSGNIPSEPYGFKGIISETPFYPRGSCGGIRPGAEQL